MRVLLPNLPHVLHIVQISKTLENGAKSKVSRMISRHESMET